MEGTIQTLTLDMLGEFRREPVLRAKQCDTNSRQVQITLLSKERTWPLPSDCKVYLYVQKPDKKIVFSLCEITGKNTILAPLTEQTLAASGTAMCELYIKTADGDIKSQTFKLVIEPMIFDEQAIVSTNEFGALEEIMVEIQEAIAITRNAAAEADAVKDDLLNRLENGELRGQPGTDGIDGAQGLPGVPGVDGADGRDGIDGLPGAQGVPGTDGEDGSTAYELAVEQGFAGTLEEWLESLVGEQGLQGPIGIQGNTGPAGEQGVQGSIGPQGLPGIDGVDGQQGIQGIPGRDGTDGAIGPQGDPGTAILYIGTTENPVIVSELPLGFCGLTGVVKSNSDGVLHTIVEVKYGTISRTSAVTYFSTLYLDRWHRYIFYITGTTSVALVETQQSLILLTSTNQAITGLKTFTTLPQSTVVPTLTTELTNKEYVDTKRSELYGLFVDERETATTGYWHKLFTCKIIGYTGTDINIILSVQQLMNAYRGVALVSGILDMSIRQGTAGVLHADSSCKWLSSTTNISTILKRFAVNVVADSTGNYVEFYTFGNTRYEGYRADIISMGSRAAQNTLTFTGYKNWNATSELTTLPINGTIIYSTLGHYLQQAVTNASNIVDVAAVTSINSTVISGLQSDTAEKWVTLDEVETRSKTNEANISALQDSVGTGGSGSDVDLSNYLSLDGGTMNGPIDMLSNNITSVRAIYGDLDQEISFQEHGKTYIGGGLLDVGGDIKISGSFQLTGDPGPSGLPNIGGVSAIEGINGQIIRFTEFNQIMFEPFTILEGISEPIAEGQAANKYYVDQAVYATKESFDMTLTDLEMKYNDLEMKYNDLEMKYNDSEMRYAELENRFVESENRFAELEMRFAELEAQLG